MMQKLTKEQINEYIINNIQTDIVKDTEYGMLKVFFKIKITGKIIYGSHLLYHIITAPLICNWQKCTIERIINKFHEYIKAHRPDTEYLKVCERLNLPDEIKNSPERFDITYLTKEDFTRCSPDDNASIYDNEHIPLSYNDTYDLCMSYNKPVTEIGKRIQGLMDSITYDIKYWPDNETDKIIILDTKIKAIEIAVIDIDKDKSLSKEEKEIIINMLDGIYKLLKTIKYKIISDKSVNESLDKMFKENSK